MPHCLNASIPPSQGVPPRCVRARTRFGGTPRKYSRTCMFNPGPPTSAKVRQKGVRAHEKFGGPSPEIPPPPRYLTDLRFLAKSSSSLPVSSPFSQNLRLAPFLLPQNLHRDSIRPTWITKPRTPFAEMPMPTKKQKPHAPLILASASPRRAELLRAAGIAFQVVVSPAPEPERKPAAIPVDLWPMCLAYQKANAVQQHLQRHKIENRKSKIENPPPLILAADTIVVIDAPPATPRLLNKARDRAHARRMLSSLHGQVHRVITGIALLQADRVRLASSQATCRIHFPTKAALEKYLDSNLWQGKAGAYGIQDSHDPFVTLLSGDFSTVVGLPMALVQSELASFKETNT